MIRLSIGLESLDDILWDIDQALEKAQRMMRYAAVPWPWVGLLVALVLLAQEILLRWLGAEPSLPQSLYRVHRAWRSASRRSRSCCCRGGASATCSASWSARA